MSDALLERQAKALEGILALLQKAPVFGLPTGGAATGAKTTPAAAAPDAAKTAAAAAAKKVADDKKKADAAVSAKAAAQKGPAAGAKAPGGKHTVEQVREAIRKVANNPSLGKASAKEILADDGGGVERVADVKPENYDKVFEACQVLLASEGAPAAPPAETEDDLM